MQGKCPYFGPTMESNEVLIVMIVIFQRTISLKLFYRIKFNMI